MWNKLPLLWFICAFVVESAMSHKLSPNLVNNPRPESLPDSSEMRLPAPEPFYPDEGVYPIERPPVQHHVIVVKPSDSSRFSFSTVGRWIDNGVHGVKDVVSDILG